MRKLLTFLIALALTAGAASAQLAGGLMFPGPGMPAASGGGSGWCSLIPQSGLVNCWPFDTANTTSGTATDVIGGKNSTQTNVTLNGSGPSTHLNNAAVFNGTTSRGDTTLTNLPTAAFSLVTWINPAVTTGAGRFIANDHTDADNKGFQATTGTSATIYIGNGTSQVNSPNPGTITASTWQMMTFTWDGTSLLGYLNTTVGLSASFTGPIAASASCGTGNPCPISFGVNPAYNGDWYNGKIAGVAIYNRALTSGEITTINGL